MSQFTIEVEQFDDKDELTLWLGEADDDGEMCATMCMSGEITDEEIEEGSTTIASFAMEWEELADFIVDYAPHLIPKMVERVINEKEAAYSKLIDIALEN